MADFEALKRQRTTLKGRATRFRTFVENYVHSDANSVILEIRLEKFNELWQEYHTLQNKIDEILSEADVEERERFEEAFFTVQAAARSKLMSTRVGRTNVHANVNFSNTNQGAPNVDTNQTAVRLPVISLPNFSGNYEQWQQFHDTFVALVHNNNNLDSVQKFHYLQSALSGSAAQVIHALPTTNDNYPIALELLTKRFQNTRLTIHHHVHELFNSSSIPKESAELLRMLVDNFRKNLRVLQQLREPVDNWDTLIIYLIVSKLDPVTKREWELKVVQEKASTVKQLFECLNSRCEFLEASHPTGSNSVSSKSTIQRVNPHNAIKGKNATFAHFAANPTHVCVLCKQSHQVYSCKIFKELSVESRRNEVKRLNLCYNCLSANHISQQCSSRSCKHCSKRHHTLLHINGRPNVTSQPSCTPDTAAIITTDSSSNIKSSEASVMASVTMNVRSEGSRCEVLLSTAILYIRNRSGGWHRVRALLDSGSQSNFITKAACRKLGLKINTAAHTISCLNATATQVAEVARSTIASTAATYETDVDFLVVDQVTRYVPSKPMDITSLNLPTHIVLADPSFYRPQGIDVLLGAAVFWDILGMDRIRLGAKKPVLQSTKLGWIVCGQICLPVKSEAPRDRTVCGLIRNEELQLQIERFWRIEDMPTTKLLSREESRCEEIYQNEHRRTPEGRFEVTLPFREDPSAMGQSKDNALRRLRSLERRFQKDPELQSGYAAFMDEYLKLGHMSAVPDAENIQVNYLPHHAVMKRSSTSTSIRVVFDASSPTTSGKSLNDCLLVGPTIQPELFEILIRFRQHPYVLTGDIVKMYRQIMIRPEHRTYQGVL